MARKIRISIILLIFLCLPTLLANNSVGHVPSITINVTTVNGTIGQSAYLLVEITFPAKYELTWEFSRPSTHHLVMKDTDSGTNQSYFLDYPGRAEVFRNNGTLRLDRLRVSDAGDYTVRIEDLTTGDLEFRTIQLVVFREDVSMTFKCKADSNIAIWHNSIMLCTWFSKQSHCMEKYTTEIDPDTNTITFRIKKAAEEDDGDYYCMPIDVQNYNYNDHLVYRKRRSIDDKQNKRETIGQVDFVECRWKNDPITVYKDLTEQVCHWEEEDKSSDCKPRYKLDMNQNSKTIILFINNPSENDSGSYVCHYTNDKSDGKTYTHTDTEGTTAGPAAVTSGTTTSVKETLSESPFQDKEQKNNHGVAIGVGVTVGVLVGIGIIIFVMGNFE